MSRIISADSELGKRIIFQCEVERLMRAATMPDEKAALRQMCNAHTRLTELGWRDWIYMPKDGTEVHLIEAGSTGIHAGFYQGNWPDGCVFIAADGDLWPSHPVLFKPKRTEARNG